MPLSRALGSRGGSVLRGARAASGEERYSRGGPALWTRASAPHPLACEQRSQCSAICQVNQLTYFYLARACPIHSIGWSGIDDPPRGSVQVAAASRPGLRSRACPSPRGSWRDARAKPRRALREHRRRQDQCRRPAFPAADARTRPTYRRRPHRTRERRPGTAPPAWTDRHRHHRKGDATGGSGSLSTLAQMLEVDVVEHLDHRAPDLL